MSQRPSSSYRVIFTAPGTATLDDQPLPPLGPNDVLIQTRVSLISPGTERAFFLGLPNTPQTYPQSSGYSNIGEILACGEQVEGWQPGMRVASSTNHAAHIIENAHKCVPVPDGLADERAAFFRLVSIALQGVRKAHIEIGEPVAVLGAGLIGLLAAQLARAAGALPVISIDRDPGRRAFAASIGIDTTLDSDEDLPSALSKMTGEDGAAVVIEATGSPQAVPTAFFLTRPGGRVILLGSTRGETEQVNFYRDIHRKGLTVVGAHDNARPQHESSAGWWTQLDDWRVALKLLTAERITVDPLITHRFYWQQATEAYELLQQWDTQALGMTLHWQEPD